jgi:hypothetical protein
MFKWLFASALAETAAPAASVPFADSLMGKGLTTTVLGLAGVFLVLFLLFVIIKGMQHIKDKEEEED